jgi:hypothetical protein
MLYRIVHYRATEQSEVVVSGKKAMIAELKKFTAEKPGRVSIAKHFDTDADRYISIAWRDWSRRQITWGYRQ